MVLAHKGSWVFDQLGNGQYWTSSDDGDSAAIATISGGSIKYGQMKKNSNIYKAACGRD